MVYVKDLSGSAQRRKIYLDYCERYSNSFELSLRNYLAV